MSYLKQSLSSSFQTLAGILQCDSEDIQPDSLKYYFELCLKEHDFYFDYSDNSHVYQRGKEELSILELALREHPEFSELWTSYLATKELK